MINYHYNELMELMDIVDSNNEAIGQCSRDEIYKRGHNHRIAHILLFNDKGQLALQKRADKVLFCPGHWVTSAGGHVKAGETYSCAASRELKEEIGVLANLDFAFYFEYPFNEAIKYLAVFTAKSNSIENTDKIHPNYVSEVRFLSLSNIHNMIENGEKFHPELLFILNYINYKANEMTI